ncbi:MAG: N-acetyltransferase family protein [Longicatena sp.]
MKKIRFATSRDIPTICTIYEYYVNNSVATFAYEAMNEKEWEEKLTTIQNKYPFLVCELDGEVVAYAYASSFREREAYQWDVELSVYVHPNVVRQQIGSSLMKVLLALLKLQNYHIAYSCITIPNDASISLHEKLGFQTIGVFKECGYKFDQWLSTAWMEYVLSNSPQPRDILTIAQCNQETIQQLLSQV